MTKQSVATNPSTGKAISRRAALRNGAVLGAALVTLGSWRALVARAAADAELVQLGAELDAAWAAQPRDADGWPVLERGGDAAAERTRAIVQRIAQLRARTFEGLRVKAQARTWCCTGDPSLQELRENVTLWELESGLIHDPLA